MTNDLKFSEFIHWDKNTTLNMFREIVEVYFCIVAKKRCIYYWMCDCNVSCWPIFSSYNKYTQTIDKHDSIH